MGNCLCVRNYEFDTTDDVIVSETIDSKKDLELVDITPINKMTPSSSDSSLPVYRIRRIGKGDTSAKIILPF